jgi:VCBS repeat-containing protein
MIWKWIHAALERTLFAEDQPNPRRNTQSCKLTVEVLEDRWALSHSTLGHSVSAVLPLHTAAIQQNETPPTKAVNDEYQVPVNGVLTINGRGVLANDMTSNRPLTASMMTSPMHGMLMLRSDGSFVYTPDRNFQGDDSFTYQARDNKGNTSIGTVRILVRTNTTQPDRVTANPDNNSTSENTSTSGNALGNDSDTLDHSLTATFVNGHSIGGSSTSTTLSSGAQVTMSSNGNYTYDPGTAFDFLAVGSTATDSFSYTADDGHGHTSSSTVTITIFGTVLIAR